MVPRLFDACCMILLKSCDVDVVDGWIFIASLAALSAASLLDIP